MTKRIKIEKAEDLKAGMRVEVEYGDGDVETGKLFKRTLLPSDPLLGLDDGSGNNITSLHLSMIENPIEGDRDTVKSIHRLIDGIGDVVVGDIVVSAQNHEILCLFVHKDLIVLKATNGQVIWYTVDEMRGQGFRIKVGESQRTELTLQELKEIAAKAKGFLILLPVLILHFVFMPILADGLDARLKTSAQRLDNLELAIQDWEKTLSEIKAEDSIIRSDVYDLDSRLSKAEVRECNEKGGQVTPYIHGVECIIGDLENDYIIKYNAN